MFSIGIDESLSLALVQPSFAKRYLEIVSAERDYLKEWLSWPAHAYDEAFFLSFIKQALHAYAEGTSLKCGLVFEGELVGNMSFNNINHDTKTVTVGYWLSAQYQGKGIINKALAKLIQMAFKEWQMEKVQISVGVDNQPSRKVCERLGFDLEGIITRAESVNGRIIDHAIYGLSRKTWLTIKQRGCQHQ